MFPDMFEMFNEDKGDSRNTEIIRPSSSESASVQSGDFFSISIGGSVLINDKPDPAKIAKFCTSVNNLAREGYKFALVVGGGKVCRNYNAAAKVLGANNYYLDLLGISVTRINASLLLHGLDEAHGEILTDVSKAREVLERGKIPVFGGILPGATTDFVAALLAESLGGTFINLSNVDGIYSSDPRKSKHAKFYPEMSYERLISILQLAETRPGQNLVLDIPAALVLKRSGIKALFLDGNDLENFDAAVRGGEFHGTVVSEQISEEEAHTTGKRIPRKKANSKPEPDPEEEDEEPLDPDEIEM